MKIIQFNLFVLSAMVTGVPASVKATSMEPNGGPTANKKGLTGAGTKGNLRRRLEPPSNDNVCEAEELPINSSTMYNNVDATAQVGEVTPGEGTIINGSSCNSQNGWCANSATVENSIWYKFIATTNTCVDIYTIGQDENDDTQLALWQTDDDGDCSDFSSFIGIAANDNGDEDLNAAIKSGHVVEGKQYYIQLDGGYLGHESIGAIFVKESEDVTPPMVECAMGQDPAGEQTERGFFTIVGYDECSNVELFVVDSVSGERFGPYPSSTFIKYEQVQRARPSAQPMRSGVGYVIKGKGPAQVLAIDGSGNEVTVDCLASV